MKGVPVDAIAVRSVTPALRLIDPARRRRGQWLAVGVIVVAAWLAPFGLIAGQLAPFWQPGHYLILLENDAELRPAGGFIGSYAVLTINHDRWPSVEFQTNIYTVDNAFAAAHAIAPPVPLAPIVDRWALRDSNWAIDFLDAAQTVADFYQQETGETVDGVIGITAHVGRSLVEQLGSVLLPDGTELTADTFYETLAYQVEKGYFLTPEGRAANEPKVIVAQLVQSVAIRLLAPWQAWQLPSLLQEMLATKFITVALFDPGQQALVEAKGWGNRVDQGSQHYLATNNANIAGLKSSQFLRQTVELAISDERGAEASYELRLTRTHTGTGRWPDHRNNNLTRLVLPAGATLTAATLDGSLVEPIVTETVANRSVVGFRIDTDPGTSRILVATARVPIDRSLGRSFVWQKQPGVTSDDVTIRYNGMTILSGSIDRDVTVPLP